MPYLFGDSFDLYLVTADMTAGYWDGGTLNALLATSVGRFAGSQSIFNGTGGGISLFKSSGSNDAVHHITCAFQQTAVLGGAAAGFNFQLQDSATTQCSIVFRSDGAILLTSAGPLGTTLATYAGAVSAQSTWFVFEIEVVINSVNGSIAVRKNGNTSNDFALGSLNTRTTANNYANRLGISGQSIVTQQYFDDVLWRSDTSSVTWLGDIRSYIRLPTSDASVQFARSPSLPPVAQTAAAALTASKVAGAGIMSAFTPIYSGTIASGTVQLSTGGTGNMKCAIYDATRTTVLATSNAVVNPIAGLNAITFGTPLAVVKGTTYYLATDQDVTLVYTTTGASQYSFTTTYASFPAASPTLTASQQGPVFIVNVATTIDAEMVNEAQENGTTSYVYDSTAGHADLYNVGTIALIPATTVAVTTRAFVQKSDAGARTAAVQIKSGATTVASSTLTLTTGWQWTWRTDSVDPNTSTAWAAAAVDAVTIGPKTVA